jgi:hypothetical protein
MKAAVEAAGLALRGGFALSEEERVGALAGRRALVLLGMVGARPWAAFAASPEACDGAPHPLDRWSRRVVTELAQRLGAVALFPFEGPPFWPFQAWARRAEPVAPSPLGLLIHPRYGLWHSYRGALAGDFEPPPVATAANPCESCEGRPCLSACPVGAFTDRGYDVPACADWLRGAGADCMSGGCLARRACPVGDAYRQAPEQAAFHMRAFLAARA